MSRPEALGDRLDTIGVKATLHEGDLVSSALVIMHVIEDDGTSRISTAWSDGLDWVTRRGMIEVARDFDRIAPEEAEDNE
jgi:hypothetical protein